MNIVVKKTYSRAFFRADMSCHLALPVDCVDVCAGVKERADNGCVSDTACEEKSPKKERKGGGGKKNKCA